MEKLDPATVPKEVTEAIRNAFPKDAEEILGSLRYHGGIDKMYSFVRWGMFVGVELDGYIHT